MFGFKVNKDPKTTDMLNEIKAKLASTESKNSAQSATNVVNAKEDIFSEDNFLLDQLDTPIQATSVADSTSIAAETSNSISTISSNEADSQKNDLNQNTSKQVDTLNASAKIIDNLIEESNAVFEDEILSILPKQKEEDVKYSTQTNIDSTVSIVQTPNANTTEKKSIPDVSYLNIEQVHKEKAQLSPNITQATTNQITYTMQPTTPLKEKVEDVKSNIENVRNHSIETDVKKETRAKVEELMNVVKNQITNSNAIINSIGNQTVDSFLRGIIEPKVVQYLNQSLPKIVNDIVEREIQGIINKKE